MEEPNEGTSDINDYFSCINTNIYSSVEENTSLNGRGALSIKPLINP